MLWAVPTSPTKRMRKSGALASDSLISGPRMRAPCLLPRTVASVPSCCARNASANGRNSSLSYGTTDCRWEVVHSRKSLAKHAIMHSGYIYILCNSSSLLTLPVSYVSSFLQCYKSSKDTCPYVDLLLPQCTVVYAPKDSKRKHHELRFTLPNGDALVLAVQSKEQAHRWLRVSYTFKLYACLQ